MVGLCLLLVALAGLISTATAEQFYACKVTDTYPSYPILPPTKTGGQQTFKDARNTFININFELALRTATSHLRAISAIPTGCSVRSTTKLRGCYDRVRPSGNGLQESGRYGFKFRVGYSCGTKFPGFLCRVRLYVTRSSRPWEPSYWRSPAVQCLASNWSGGRDDTTNVPSAPTVLKVSESADGQQVVIDVRPPSNDGGWAIRSYTVYAQGRQGGKEIAETVAPTSVGSNVRLAVRRSRFTEGMKYTWSIAAVNFMGVGKRSSTKQWRLPDRRTVPEAPTIWGMYPFGPEILMDILLPNPGRTPITLFEVVAKPVWGGNTVVRRVRPSYIDGDAQLLLPRSIYVEGVDYEWKAMAINSLGMGPESGPFGWTIPPRTAPSEPTIGNMYMSQSLAEIVIEVTPPADDGGFDVLDYFVIAVPLNGLEPITLNKVPFQTLAYTDHVMLRFSRAKFVKDEQYEFRVAARNSVGLGAQSPAYTFTVPF